MTSLPKDQVVEDGKPGGPGWEFINSHEPEEEDYDKESDDYWGELFDYYIARRTYAHEAREYARELAEQRRLERDSFLDGDEYDEDFAAEDDEDLCSEDSKNSEYYWELAEKDYQAARRRMAAKPKPRKRRVVSLSSLAAQVVACNTKSMTRKHFEFLSHSVLSRIWNEIKERKLPSFHEWKTVCPLLFEGEKNITMDSCRHQKNIMSKQTDLECFTKPLNSLNIDFITHLTLNGYSHFGESDMMSLAEMKNLGVLAIVHSTFEAKDGEDLEMSDAIIQGWMEMDNPYPVLRILQILGPSRLSIDSLSMVSKFPSLVLYDVDAFAKPLSDPIAWARTCGWSFSQDGYNMGRHWFEYFGMPAHTKSAECGGERCYCIGDPDRKKPDWTHMSSDCEVRLSEHDTASSASASSWEDWWRSDPHHSYRDFPIRSAPFWAYSIIGELQNDADLKRAGARVNRRAQAEGFLLPSKPLVSVTLGSLASAPKPDGLARWVFTRAPIPHPEGLGDQSFVLPETRGKRASDGHSEDVSKLPALKRQKGPEPEDLAAGIPH